MNGTLGPFSLVDRIAEIGLGRRVRGRFAVPAAVASFPASLAVEAVGQLAAWAAMAAADFQSRPVAGLAGLVEIFGAPRPGDILDLSVDLQHAEADAIAYAGLAEVDGRPLVRLTDCVGPMLPMADFDDPQAVRERFGLLCGSPALPSGFAGLPPLPLHFGAVDPGRELRATLQVPASAAFFADHFPRRPVFPGTLLHDAMLRLAARLIGSASGAASAAGTLPSRVSNVKLRAFIPPGERLELSAVLEEAGPRESLLALSARMGNKTVAGARLAVEHGAAP
jgi:3-hydroxymyristoyl/3-hydroxydecanoyl-(acyl carrier protein) dehydratase